MTHRQVAAHDGLPIARETRARCGCLSQYRVHKETGEVMLTGSRSTARSGTRVDTHLRSSSTTKALKAIITSGLHRLAPRPSRSTCTRRRLAAIRRYARRRRNQLSACAVARRSGRNRRRVGVQQSGVLRPLPVPRSRMRRTETAGENYDYTIPRGGERWRLSEFLDPGGEAKGNDGGAASRSSPTRREGGTDFDT